MRHAPEIVVTEKEPIGIMREAERLMVTGLSRVHWWRLERMGQAPVRLQLGPNAVGWSRREIADWMQRKMDERPKHSEAAQVVEK
jgi:predicted DNA-binding transcriptional regulator AlpA